MPSPARPDLRYGAAVRGYEPLQEERMIRMATNGTEPLAFKRRCARGSTTEFSIALYIFLLIIAFPLLDLFGVSGGAAVMLLGANQVATTVAAQRRFPDCLTSMQAETDSFLSGNFARFMKLRPVGGYKSTGADLFIEQSSIVGGKSDHIGPNAPVPPPIDTSSNIYECTVQLNCEVGPFMNLSFVPFLGNVPGLGKPALLSLSSSRSVEYPRGLEYPSSDIASAGGALPTLYQSPTASVPPGNDGSGWNNPTIYDMIKAAGQKVLAQEVIEVHAINGNFTPTSISVAPGQSIWIDTRADGSWNTSADDGNANADGYNYYPATYMCPSAPAGSLIGKLSGSGAPFFLGVDKFNYPPAGTGTLGLMINDGADPSVYTDNNGVQIVRVILVQ